MADMKREILEKLEQGKINAQEAWEMLNGQRPSEPAPPPEPQERAGGAFSWLDEMVQGAAEVVQDVVEGIQDADMPGIFSDMVGFGRYENSQRFTSRAVFQGVSKLTLIGKNDKVLIRGYDGDTINLECRYVAKRPDVHVYFDEEDGHFRLMYDEKLMRQVAINCEVPRVMIKEALFACKNGKLTAQGLSAGTIKLANKNDAIRAEDLNCAELIAQNRNASIKIRAVTAQNIHLETTNDNLSIESVRAYAANLQTTNSRVKTEAVDIQHLRIKTTNTGLKLEKTYLDAFDGERVLEAQTTNGGIAFAVPSGIGLKIEADTRGGKVVCGRDDLYFSESSKGHMRGESRDYNMHGSRLNVKLITTNSTIKIMA